MRARQWPPKSPATPPWPASITARLARSPVVLTRHGPRLQTHRRSWRRTEMAPARTREQVVKIFFLPMVLGILPTPASAQSLQVVGYSGYLGEWELTATVTETASGPKKEYSGPLTMRHVGMCTQDGPEEKTGEMRLQISASSSQLNATFSVAGVECTYSGRLADSYTGTMDCPDRQAVPLKLWVR